MSTLKIVKGYPPNLSAIIAAFPCVQGLAGAVFTYGDTVYVPSGNPLPHHLKAHEATHVRQQAEMGAAAWWDRYLTDPAFCLSQEVEAYHAQYMAMSKVDRLKHIRRLAGLLSGPMYGSQVSFDRAKEMIRTGVIE